MRTFVKTYSALTVSFGFVILAGVKDGDDLFSGYKQTDSFKNFINWQKSRHDQFDGDQILKVSTFLGGNDWQTEQFLVGTNGQGFARTLADGSGAGDGKSYKLTLDDVKRMNEECSKLPESVIHPPLNRLLCISYNDPVDPKKWITKTFNISEIPESLQNVFVYSHFKKSLSYRKLTLALKSKKND